MIILKDFDSLKNFLSRDKDAAALNPIRIINVDSISMWSEVKNFLATLATKCIFLSDFCEDEDTMPNTRRLYSALKNENQSTYILPLSEFFRLNPEIAADELKKILNISSQGTKNFRLYFLMYRLRSVFRSLKITDPRKKDSLILLETNQEDEYSLTVIQKSMQLNLAGNSADGLKKYLQYWEGSPNAPLNLHTDNAEFLQDKIFFDDVKVIVNAFDLLRHHYELPAELKKNFCSNAQWEKLAIICNREGNLKKAFHRELGTEIFHTKIFSYWGDNFKRRLLWLWCKLQPQNFYAAICARNSDSLENFPAQIYLKIFDFVDAENFEQIYNERREILSLIKIPAPGNFLEKVRHADKKFALKVLTDTSTQELKLIFETLKKFSYAEYDKALKILRTGYPALEKYLSTAAEIFSDEQQNYFRLYRWLKVTDNLTEDFYKLVAEFAAQKGKEIYSLKTRNQIVAEEYSADAAIFFVDAMGAEYLNFLAQNFSTIDTEKFSVKYQVGYCALPTTTEFNKDFLINRNVAGETVELDKIKHSTLNYPENIICELNFLSTLKEKILTALEKFSKIIICADHGSSRLAVIARKTKFDKTFSSDGRKIYNCGRFADALPNDEEIFSNVIHDGDRIILTDYSRFIQQGSPGNEIHGGATLEEWLVPVITIERRLKNSPRQKISQPKRIGIAANKNFDI